MSGAFSSDNCDPLTCQVTMPITLQLKVAVDPRVTLTDVGVLTNSGMTAQEERNSFIEYNNLNLNPSKETQVNAYNVHKLLTMFAFLRRTQSHSYFGSLHCKQGSKT